MKVVEIIHVRSSTLSPEELSELIATSLRQETAPEEDVRIYSRDGLDTDLAVHVRHADENAATRSELGLHLAAALRELGAVKHTLWRRLV